ncbi:MAG: glycosyltransferase family 4 protein [Thermoleophilia bacterium]|nr:glycosyltransferase family 4 protein [Thermoleophilia bacterium]
MANFLSAQIGARGVTEELAARLEDRGWPVIATSTRPGRAERLADMVRTVWRSRRDYDVAAVDVFSGQAFIWAQAACAALRLAGKPYVLALRGGNLPVFARRRPRSVRSLLTSAAAVIVPSGFLAREMRPYRGSLRLLPNPIELSRYPYVCRDHVRPRLIWLRAFHQIYNPSLAPRVLALLAPHHPDVELCMIGRDKGDGSLQAMLAVAKSLGVRERITLPGGVPKDEVPRWLAQGDVFLNTTDFDNAPVSVIEALACGLCVVSTDAGGIPDLLRHEGDALLVPAGEAEAMARAVDRVLSEPGLSGRLSRRARATAEAFDWAFILPRWESLLSAAAGGRP